MSDRIRNIFYIVIFSLLTTACSSGGDAIDKFFGADGPIITSQTSKIVAQTDLLKIDANNIKDGEPGNDEDMTYTCFFDRTMDGVVGTSQPCTAIPQSTVTFDSNTGVLNWTPQQDNANLGEYELKVVGKNDSGESYQLFNVSVRLKFNGLTSIQNITGISADLAWIPNPNAVAYQVYKVNLFTGLYELHETFSGGASTGGTITGLNPNTNYTIRVQALDTLGFPDGNLSSNTFVTTELVKFSMHSSSPSGVAGTPVTITVQAYNSDDSLQTIGGLAVSALLTGGTSSGNFSAVTDNSNGTYTFTFTPTTVGTAATLEVSTITTTFFLINPIVLSIAPGPATAANSNIASTSNTVVSGNNVTITAHVRDQYNNPITTGPTISFQATGGTSTGTFSAVTNHGNGMYTAIYTGVLAGTAKNIAVVVDGNALAMSTPVAVTPGVASSVTSTLAVSQPTLPSGTDSLVTATLKDLAGNPISSGVMVAFNKSGGTSTGTFDGVVNAGNGVYTVHYTGILVGSPQTISVSVDGSTLIPIASITVVPGVPHAANSNLALSANTVVSGNYITATATIKDINNNPIDSGITVSFTKSGGTSTGTFGAVSNQGSGQYNVRYTGIVSGSAQNIQIQIGGVNFGAASTITVIPGIPTSANSTLAISSPTILSGTLATLTATLRDLNNNLISSGHSVAFNKAGGTSTGNFDSVTNNGNGTYTTTYTGIVAGSAQTINMVVDGGALTPTVTVTVNVAAPDLANSTIALTAANVVSGQFVTANALIRDLNNNTISSGITVTFNKSGGTSTGTFGIVNNLGAGQYSIQYTGITAGTAQSIQMQINGVNFGSALSITVKNGAPSAGTSTLAVSSSTVNSGSDVTVTATLRDDNNNLVATGYAVTFGKSGGTSTGTYDTITNNGNGTYSTTYTGVIAGTAQTLSISVDGAPIGVTTNITVLPGAPSSLLSTLVLSANTIVAGTNATLTATIKDANGNPISSGLLVMFDKIGGTSTGTLSVVTNQGSGVYTATYSGIVAGSAQTIQANVNGAGFGPSQSLQVIVGPPSLANSSLILSANTVSSGSFITMTAVVRDAQNNPVTNQYVISFDAIGGSSTGTLSTVNNLGSGSFSTTYTGLAAGTAQTVRVFADGAQITGLTSTITVTAGPVSLAHSTFTIANVASAVVQSTSSATLAMNLRDSNSNAISSGSTVVTFVKSAGGSNGNISAVTNSGGGNYSATYTATTMGALQTIGLTVNGTVTGMSVGATVTAGPPTQLLLTTSPSGTLASIDCLGPYTVTLKDANANTTVSVSPVNITLSSTPAQTLPTLPLHTGVLFNDASCATTPVTGFSIPASTSTLTFYYKSYRPQSIALRLNPNLSIAYLDVNITNIPVLAWMGSSAYFTMNGSGSQNVFDDSSGGLYQPLDTVIVGDYLYVADYATNRIVKYNIATNTLVGWIGHVGSTDDMTAADGSSSCTGLNIATAQLTPTWCVGGRSNFYNAPLLVQPRQLASDGIYLYVASGQRILRFLLTDGSYKGWYGRIAGIVGMTDDGVTGTVCSSAGATNTTPRWCYGGTNAAGVTDGQFNTITSLTYHNNYLYIADYTNHRLQRLDVSGVNPVFGGWIGNIQTTLPTSPTACANAALGDATPTWCFGGRSGAANRYNLPAYNPAIPSTLAAATAPNEGYYNPRGIATDGTYLYIADYNNHRIVRNDLVTGTFEGWIGYARANSASYPNPMVPNVPTGYTPGWIQGGVVGGARTGTDGFYNPIHLYVDTTQSPVMLYIADGVQRLSQIRVSDGQGPYRWIGRNSASPTGGNTGCSSSAVGATNPGWCTGGAANRYGNTSGAFYNPAGFSVTATKIYIADSTNARVQRFDKSSGNFDGWIGAGAVVAQKWSRDLAPGTIPARAGFDDYSFLEYTVNANWYAGITGNGKNMFQTDVGWHRVKKFNLLDGSSEGYVGNIGGFGPTGPGECVGYTSGFTPTWCQGGGRSVTGTAVHGYNLPFSLGSDEDYIYVGNYGNNRIDRIRINDGTYMGWIGYIQTSPTDGEGSCSGAPATTYTPGWCIGGTSNNVNTNAGFNTPRAVYHDNLTSVLYVASTTGRLIKLNKTTGAFLGVTGGVSTGTGCTVTSNVANGWCATATGVATNGYGGINTPTGVASNTNYIFVSDNGNNRVTRFEKITGSPAGFIGGLTNATQLNTAAASFTVNGLTTANGCLGFSGFPKGTPGWCIGAATGSATPNTLGTGDAMFDTPRGIWADDSNVYVSDFNNHRIMKFDAATGSFVGWKGYIANATGMTCLSGTPATGGVTPDWCKGGLSGPGKALGAFDAPGGLHGDANYIYVIDLRNNRTVTVPR